MFVNWIMYINLVNFSATGYCKPLHLEAQAKDCQEQIADCVLDGEDFKFCTDQVRETYPNLNGTLLQELSDATVQSR